MERRYTVEQVKITYWGHACFCLESKGYRVVLDPYADHMVPGLPPLHLEAEAVYCSHCHDDHNYTQAISLAPPMEPPYSLTELTVPHDHKNGAHRGMNTIRIFTFGSLRVAHFGDIGCPLTEDERKTLQHLDCIMIPVGGYYTIDPNEAAEMVRELDPRVTIPMHYRTEHSGFAETQLLDEFTKQYSHVQHGGQALMLTSQTPKQIHILHYVD